MKRIIKVCIVLCTICALSIVSLAETPTTLAAYERLGIDAEDVVEILNAQANDDWKNVISRNTDDVNMNLLLATLHMTDGDNWDKVDIEGIRTALYDSELPLLPKEEVDNMTNSQAIIRYISLMIEYLANLDYYSD